MTNYQFEIICQMKSREVLCFLLLVFPSREETFFYPQFLVFKVWIKLFLDKMSEKVPTQIFWCFSFPWLFRFSKGKTTKLSLIEQWTPTHILQYAHCTCLLYFSGADFNTMGTSCHGDASSLTAKRIKTDRNFRQYWTEYLAIVDIAEIDFLNRE